METVRVGGGSLKVAEPTVDAWKALEFVFDRHGYVVRRDDTGGYNDRAITGGTLPSLHAYGIAADVNWTTNPYKKTPKKPKVRYSNGGTQSDRALDVRYGRADTDMAAAMIADVKAIRTLGGLPVFGWGGNFKSTKDTMHFQLDVSPAELARGIDWALLGASLDDEDGPGDPDDEAFGPDPDDDHQHDHGTEQAEEIMVAGLTASIIAAAQASEANWGVPASVTLAQYILESAGGKRMPPGSNNPFGIKAKAGQPSVGAATWEVVNGRRVNTSAGFRKFGSIQEAFDSHGRLLATSRYYTRAMALKHDPFAFADALTGVYATDPAYGAKLKNIIRKYDLTRYDRGGSPGGYPPMPETGDDSAISNGALFYGTLAIGAKGAQVIALQQTLKQLGYPVGNVDGVYGTITQGAVAAFQADNGLYGSGEIDGPFWTALSAAARRPLSPDRTGMTAEELRRRGSRTISNADNTKLAGLFAAILGALGIGNSTIVTADNSLNGGDYADRLQQAVQRYAQTVNDYITATSANGLRPASKAALDALKQAEQLVQQVRTANGLTPDLLANLETIKDRISQSDLIANPSLMRLVQEIDSLQTAAPPIRTVFDVLPQLVQGSPQLHSIAEVIASIAGSMIPGFGGSVAIGALGIAARVFGNRIIGARVDDHRTGNNIGR